LTIKASTTWAVKGEGGREGGREGGKEGVRGGEGSGYEKDEYGPYGKKMTE
jgi:hypothetical protein